MIRDTKERLVMIWNIVTIPVSKQEALKFMFLLFVHGVYFLSDFNGFFLNEFLSEKYTALLCNYYRFLYKSDPKLGSFTF
jgi:hypothetical protein